MTSDTVVLSSASHEIAVMPWLFGRDVAGVNWMSPIAPFAGVLRDPQMLILELALVFVALFVTAGYAYEIKCEIVGKKGTIELAPTSQVVVRSDLKVSQNFP